VKDKNLFCSVSSSFSLSPIQLAGLLSAIVVMIVTLALGFLLEPLPRVRREGGREGGRARGREGWREGGRERESLIREIPLIRDLTPDP